MHHAAGGCGRRGHRSSNRTSLLAAVLLGAAVLMAVHVGPLGASAQNNQVAFGQNPFGNNNQNNNNQNNNNPNNPNNQNSPPPSPSAASPPSPSPSSPPSPAAMPSPPSPASPSPPTPASPSPPTPASPSQQNNATSPPLAANSPPIPRQPPSSPSPSPNNNKNKPPQFNKGFSSTFSSQGFSSPSFSQASVAQAAFTPASNPQAVPSPYKKKLVYIQSDDKYTYDEGYNWCQSKGLFYISYDDRVKKAPLRPLCYTNGKGCWVGGRVQSVCAYIDPRGNGGPYPEPCSFKNYVVCWGDLAKQRNNPAIFGNNQQG
ncbi:hypothetical protein HYH02_011351 [Chlamydomonas schloesseri]|uniref:Uncharacterized protein n=2 Tax=Chlamydomonas schloesseri TaxID=2026947 RepID=A0A835T1G8_9CHLO|nr:hypothetical protein HYH02_011351 [Chlamydomonas schloesseri]|eukprot:KAG2437093.1 hypothetical protein HYH02_011351 [Chlamydomonas schloesseri]